MRFPYDTLEAFVLYIFTTSGRSYVDRCGRLSSLDLRYSIHIFWLYVVRGSRSTLPPYYSLLGDGLPSMLHHVTY